MFRTSVVLKHLKRDKTGAGGNIHGYFPLHRNTIFMGHICHKGGILRMKE